MKTVFADWLRICVLTLGALLLFAALAPAQGSVSAACANHAAAQGAMFPVAKQFVSRHPLLWRLTHPFGGRFRC